MSVVIDGANAGLDILIDDISITPAEEIDVKNNPYGCVVNGDFEIGDSRYCKCNITNFLLFYLYIFNKITLLSCCNVCFRGMRRGQ